MQQAEGDAFDIIIESKAGRAMRGIDVSVICDGRTRARGRHWLPSASRSSARRPPRTFCSASACTACHPGDSSEVAAQAGANKAYVFEFDAGDLGLQDCLARAVAAIEDGTHLSHGLWRYTPIRELTGRTFRYSVGSGILPRSSRPRWCGARRAQPSRAGTSVTDLAGVRAASSGC